MIGKTLTSQLSDSSTSIHDIHLFSLEGGVVVGLSERGFITFVVRKVLVSRYNWIERNRSNLVLFNIKDIYHNEIVCVTP